MVRATGPAGLIQAHGDDLMHLGAIPRRNALRFPDRRAYVCGDKEISWRDFELFTDRLAYTLKARGVGYRDHVAILGDNSIEFLAVEFSLFKIGAVAVLTNLGLPAPMLSRQLRHADVKAVFTSNAELRERVESIRDDSGVDIHFTWDPTVDETFAGRTVDDLVREGKAELTDRFPLQRIEMEDTALLVFSSGTTGEPKGAINGYRDVEAKLFCNALAQEFRQWEIGFVGTQLCMGGTQLLSVLPYALLGMTCVIAPTFDPRDVIKAIEAHRANTMFAVPTMIQDLISHPSFKDADLSCLDRIISAGAPLPEHLYRAVMALGIRQFELGGASETGGGVIITDVERATKPGSVGRPYAGYVIRILKQDGEEAEPGEIGEIVIGGDAISKGYYGQPELTATSYRDGWFFTGDLGKRDKDGYFYYAGRAKDMILTGGSNVYPRDVEEVLIGAPGVRQVAVLGLPHPHWGEAVTAFVVCDNPIKESENRIQEFCRENLMRIQVPKAVVFLRDLPKTIHGKVAKQALSEEYAGLYSDKPAETS
ncbi:MAG: AMP-binding protein [Alphaproteobacteria bacterium]